jgi:ankyrin repeat protein
MDARLADNDTADSEDYIALTLAAKKQDKETVVTLKERGVAIDIKDADGITPAGRLAAENDIAAVNFLLDLGADINVELS